MAATPTTDLGFQNFFQATLTGDITASSTDIPMDNIPNSTQGFLVIEPDSATNREVIFYTSKTALKVVCPSVADGRGQDDTSASAHSTGATVIMAPVAAFFEALQNLNALNDIETSNISSAAKAALRSRNLLINGNMDVWQRNTSASPNDDVYSGADRWNFLTETNGAWTVARDTDVPAGSRYSMKCTNVTLNNQMAIVQILEAADTKPLDDGFVSLSFYAKTTASEIANLRAAVLTWGSTADSVTSDVIGTWAQNGTDPTWAANWTAENTPSNLALTNSWQKFTIENIAIDSGTVNNLAVVIWVDDGTVAANDDFWVTQVQLNYGTTAVDFQANDYATEFAKCQRYYQDISGMSFRKYVSNVHRETFLYHTQMRVSPTATKSYSPANLGTDNSAGVAIGWNLDFQYTAAGSGVIDGTLTTIKLDAEL